ncbi:MAG: hypothetical protein HOD92_26170 [Deltaproteobacteria bacterium]|nr:hypothetical protein [Deltaproteobacteria bacterium]MBT4525149.1 hypothetical protein [Deltaproteobacteria bacterium]
MASSDDPCADTDLFGCQPRLLKLYLKMSRELFRATRLFMREIGRHLGQLKNGASGIVTEGDGTTIHYSKISARQWDVLAITPDGAFFDVSINLGSAPDSISKSFLYHRAKQCNLGE